MKHVMETFFPWHGDYQKATWVGVEPNIYWIKLGQQLDCQRRYPAYKPSSGAKLSSK